MRKFVLMLMLATVSSLWTFCAAICLATSTPPDGNIEVMAGILQWADMPCEEGEPCAPCITPVLVTDEQTFYLTALNDEIEARIDSIMKEVELMNCICWAQVGITGVPYQIGSFDYLHVLHIDSVRIIPQPITLPSLCDEWHMETYTIVNPDKPDYHIYTQRLTTDTIINAKPYRQLHGMAIWSPVSQDGNNYLGALRQGNNADIYYVPAGGTHEFLLYAFNAGIGDTLRNVWLGGTLENYNGGGFDLVVEGMTTDYNTETYLRCISGWCEIYSSVRWIQYVGLHEGPVGWSSFPGEPGEPIPELVCACKDGERLYKREWGNTCECDLQHRPKQGDTIPLYVKDGPGSTTVTPVDPNQVVATLNDNLLTIHEKSGEEVTYSLAVTSIGQAPARHDMPAAQKEVAINTFRNNVSIQLLENGTYTLTLTNPKWEADIYGTFDYITTGWLPATATDTPARKILSNGQLLILQGDKCYTPTGLQIK